MNSGSGKRPNWCLEESFDAFWEYKSPYWAKRYLHMWCTRAIRSQLEPMKKFVRTIRTHENLILNYRKPTDRNTRHRYWCDIRRGFSGFSLCCGSRRLRHGPSRLSPQRQLFLRKSRPDRQSKPRQRSLRRSAGDDQSDQKDGVVKPADSLSSFSTNDFGVELEEFGGTSEPLPGLDGGAYEEYTERPFESWVKTDGSKMPVQGRLRMSDNLDEAKVFYMDVAGRDAVRVEIQFRDFHDFNFPYHVGTPIRLTGSVAERDGRPVLNKISELVSVFGKSKPNKR